MKRRHISQQEIFSVLSKSSSSRLFKRQFNSRLLNVLGAECEIANHGAFLLQHSVLGYLIDFLEYKKILISSILPNVEIGNHKSSLEMELFSPRSRGPFVLF